MASASMFVATPFAMASELNGTSWRLRPSGELDLATVPTLERALVCAQQPGSGSTTVDLNGLTFMGLAGVRLFERAYLRALTNGTRLSLVQASPSVMRLLSLLKDQANLPGTIRGVLEIATGAQRAT